MSFFGVPVRSLPIRSAPHVSEVASFLGIPIRAVPTRSVPHRSIPLLIGDLAVVAAINMISWVVYQISLVSWYTDQVNLISRTTYEYDGEARYP